MPGHIMCGLCITGLINEKWEELQQLNGSGLAPGEPDKPRATTPGSLLLFRRRPARPPCKIWPLRQQEPQSVLPALLPHGKRNTRMQPEWPASDEG